jgi:hypothetical protein
LIPNNLHMSKLVYNKQIMADAQTARAAYSKRYVTPSEV